MGEQARDTDLCIEDDNCGSLVHLPNCPEDPDSTPTEREAGDVGEVELTEDEIESLVYASGPDADYDPLVDAVERIIAERERAAGVRALREADVVLIDDDTAIGLAMQENALLAGLRGPWEIVTPREHWRLYRRMAPENAQDAL